ncbi:hypothetical protein BJ944DRAFT_242449 [Cunninghamella echinulata]|nr:hypothetical protein BJ944DRAFT_242449 [Cunninghamella echinulata]
MDSHERNNDIHNSTNSNTTNNSNNNINYNNDQQNEKHGFIFEVQRKNKIYHFKTKTSVELIEWCRALNNVATEVSVQKLLEKRKQRELSRQQQQQQQQQQQSKSFDSSSQHLHPQQQQHQQQSRHHHRDIVFIGHTDDDVDEDDNLSQFHSIHTSEEDSSILNTALIESDIISLDIGNNASSSNVSNFHPPSTPSSSPHPYSTTTSATTGMDLSPSQLIPPKVNIQKDESGIYFSSTSSPSSSSSTSSPPPPIPSTSTSQRAIPTYQANLNLNF